MEVSEPRSGKKRDGSKLARPRGPAGPTPDGASPSDVGSARLAGGDPMRSPSARRGFLAGLLPQGPRGGAGAASPAGGLDPAPPRRGPPKVTRRKTRGYPRSMRSPVAPLLQTATATGEGGRRGKEKEEGRGEGAAFWRTKGHQAFGRQRLCLSVRRNLGDGQTGTRRRPSSQAHSWRQLLIGGHCLCCASRPRRCLSPITFQWIFVRPWHVPVVARERWRSL